MIIDKNFKGLTKKIGYYEFIGNIKTNESIAIKINLKISGYIRANGYIWAGGDIRADGDIGANGYIWANGDIRADGYIGADGDIWALSEIKFKDNIIFYGIKSETIRIIIGQRWKIWIIDTHIKIGCEFHTIEEWENFSDEKINKMNKNALEWWKENKDWILAIPEAMKKK